MIIFIGQQESLYILILLLSLYALMTAISTIVITIRELYITNFAYMIVHVRRAA